MRKKINKISNNIVMKTFRKIIKNDLLQKVIVIGCRWLLVFIPVYISIFFWWILDPISFVERLLLILLCLVALGWLQVLLIFVGLVFTLKVLDEW